METTKSRVFTLRLPNKLYEDMKHYSWKCHRSLNRHIIAVCNNYVVTKRHEEEKRARLKQS